MAGQMMTTIKLTRGDSSPWGFRLQGGKDWSLPLSVSKVQSGSLADKGGLKVGDIIAKICGHSAEGMLHKEAQDVILRAGNNLDITVVKGCTSTWQPKVTPVASSTGVKVPPPPPPSSSSASSAAATQPASVRPVSAVFDPPLVTNTSLAYNQMPSAPIGSSHNKTPVPFQTFGSSTLPLVNKQYNSPINLYSMKNIKDTIDAHSELIAPGVKGINFMKPDAPVNTQSAVYQAILEEEAKSKGTATNQELSPFAESLRQSSTSPVGLSQSFRKLKCSLDGPEGASPVPPNQLSSSIGGGGGGTSSPLPRIGFPPHSLASRSGPVTKHVEAPVMTNKTLELQQQQQAANTCAECGRLIVGVFCRINDKNLHSECFKCSTCGNLLKNVGYFNINDKLYCDVHAAQAAKISNRNSTYEPLTSATAAPIDASSSFTLNTSVFQSGLAPGGPTTTATSPASTFAASLQPSGKTSPLLQAVSAMPWHSTQSYHHVDAPVSPVPGQGSKGFSLLQNRVAATNPPMLPPKFDQPRPGSIYQPSPQPYSASTTGQSNMNVQQQQQQQQQQSFTGAPQSVIGGSKFSWPPKGASNENLNYRTAMQNQSSITTSSSIEQSTISSSSSGLTIAGSLSSQPEPVNVLTAASTTISSEKKETAASSLTEHSVVTDSMCPGVPVAASAVAAAASVNYNSPCSSESGPCVSSQSLSMPPTTTTCVTTSTSTTTNSEVPLTEPPSQFIKSLELRSRSNSVTNAVAEIERQVTQVNPTLSTGGKVPPPTLPKPSTSSVPSVIGNSTATPWSASGTSNSSNNTTSNFPLPATPTSLPSSTASASVAAAAASSSSSTVPGPGRSTIAGSKQAARRGRGQLKPPGTPGTRVPICAVCQVPIRGPFIVALGKTWCRDHFNCANASCRRSLQEIGFVEEQNQLYCESCFEAYLPNCAKCNVPIKGDCLIAIDKNWHPNCFACCYCKSLLGNNPFYLEDGLPYCQRDWNELFTTKCIACGFPIAAGDRWVEALNNNFHAECFKCTACHSKLEGQSFFAKGGRPYCKSHAR